MHDSGQAPPRLIKAIEQLQLHDHPCLIYETRAELLAVVVPFTRIGWERGERCLYFAPEAGVATIPEELASAGIDAAGALAQGTLLIPDIHRMYGRDEPFDPDRALEFLHQALSEAKRDGFTGLRLIGEMSWTLERPLGTERLIEYEFKKNDFILNHDLPALCAYDRTRFPPEVLLDIIRTHPKVIFGNVISRNYSYLPPDVLFRPERVSLEVDLLLRGMLTNEELITALEERQALLNAVVENSPDAIYVKDRQGRYLMINPAGAAFLGKKIEEVLGRDDSELFSPDSAEKILEIDRQTQTCGRPLTAEETLTSAGATRTFHSTKGVYCDAKGNVIGLFGIARDITERKNLEKALRESENRFRTLCDSAPIGIFRSDSEGNNIYCNPRWEEITGMSALEGMGKGWSKAIHPADRAELGKVWLEVMATGGSYSHEHRYLTPQGKTIWVRGLANPIKSPDGRIFGYVGTLEDITELRQARQEMLKTQKLESLGILAGGIAHDFNNILTAILGNISLARLQLHAPDKVTKRLEEAENAAARAKDLTQQLLTFARGGEPVKKIIEVHGLMRESADFALHGSSVSCEFALADDLWPVEADEGQLSQVIHNLVLNAVQAMPEGGAVTISAENVNSLLKGKHFVKISVADTGAGISESHLQRIFDPYFTTKQQGSGLGLATCYSIIKRHGGKIRATSVLGKGSTFHISLPAAELGNVPAPPSPTAVSPGSGRVLVMDDEEPVRMVARAMLEELGYMVECAENGSDAGELSRKRKEEGAPFAVVIMDLTIPGGVGGREAITMLLKIDPDVKAVVSSGYSTDPVMANYGDFGFCAVLSKPYRPNEMSKVLQELLTS